MENFQLLMELPLKSSVKAHFEKKIIVNLSLCLSAVAKNFFKALPPAAANTYPSELQHYKDNRVPLSLISSI